MDVYFVNTVLLCSFNGDHSWCTVFQVHLPFGTTFFVLVFMPPSSIDALRCLALQPKTRRRLEHLLSPSQLVRAASSRWSSAEKMVTKACSSCLTISISLGMRGMQHFSPLGNRHPRAPRPCSVVQMDAIDAADKLNFARLPSVLELRAL